ncbi:hypothetical protein, partial [Citrobacter koseri]|uniref:hypothetical protein n=1 Tax=Citrobacter koseri TaxID=545 RepID=UPI002231DB77
MATQNVLSGLQPGVFGICRMATQRVLSGLHSLVYLVLPDGDATRLIRPTQPGVFGIAGWRR